jgi:hypothetical protein
MQVNEIGLQPGMLFAIVVIALGVTAIARGRIGDAIGRWIDTWGRDRRGHSPGEVEHLRQQVAGLPTLEARVAELEERLDFAERLLAQSREPERLPGRTGAP